jgi:hypothetical protein
MSHRHLLLAVLVPVLAAGCAVSTEEPAPTPDESTATAEGAAKIGPCAAVRCKDGYRCVAKHGVASCQPVLCAVSACGPALGLPNRICPDGVTVSGPTGNCLKTSAGCGWEVISCP